VSLRRAFTSIQPGGLPFFVWIPAFKLFCFVVWIGKLRLTVCYWLLLACFRVVERGSNGFVLLLGELALNGLRMIWDCFGFVMVREVGGG